MSRRAPRPAARPEDARRPRPGTRRAPAFGMHPSLRLTVQLALAATACLSVVGCGADERSAAATDDADLTAVDAAIAERAPEFARTEAIYARDGVAVVRAPGGAILLRARDEATARSVLEGLAALRERAGEPTAALPPLRPMASGWVEAKLDALLTPYLAQTHGKVIDDNSVQSNCWGHSAAVAGVVTGVKELSAAGFTGMLASPLCRRLAHDEPASPGDIVTLRSVDERDGRFTFEEVHTAVVVTDDVWSTKNGAGSFEIESAARVIDRYMSDETPAACRRRSTIPLAPAELRACQSAVELFRCESVASYRARVGGPFPTYDALLTAMGPLLWETVLQQRAAESAGDPVIPKGLAFVSKHPFDPVKASFAVEEEQMSPSVAKRLRAMASDPFYGAAYDRALPVVPALPFAYDVDGDGYAKLTERYQGAEQEVKAALERDLSPAERPLVELLFLEVASSQLSRLESSPSERARRLLAPPRVLDVAAE